MEREDGEEGERGWERGRGEEGKHDNLNKGKA